MHSPTATSSSRPASTNAASTTTTAASSASSSSSGFKNVQPKGRESRTVHVDKHSFEKQRLANRREGFQRHDPDTNPIRVQENALGYMKDTERFHTDVAGEEKAKRDNTFARKQQIINSKREMKTERERQLKEQSEKTMEREDRRLEYKRQSEGTRKNNSGVQYDLITMDSKTEKDRLSENYRRQMAHHSGAVRAARLFQKDSSVGYNVLTGEARVNPTHIPERPPPPQ